ncbi:Photosystem I assembly protein Ycf3 [Bienertia sinuspersici]
MPRSRINGNLLIRPFNCGQYLLRIIPTTSGEKEAFTYYRDVYATRNRSLRSNYILYNIGLIHTSNGEHTKALEYYLEH